MDIQSYFSDITFDEGPHIYTLDGKAIPSVSTILKRFYDEFDTENISLGYANKWGFHQEDVKDAWRGNALIATTHGTKVHLFGESYAKWKYFHIGDRPQVTCRQCLGIVQFYNNLPDYIYPVNLELQMYNRKWWYSGTCDILLYNGRDDYYILGDYKTNGELEDTKFRKPMKLIPPELGLYQDNLGKYSLQLTLYGMLLASVGIDVRYRCIVWLKEQGDGQLHKNIFTKDYSEWVIPNLT